MKKSLRVSSGSDSEAAEPLEYRFEQAPCVVNVDNEAFASSLLVSFAIISANRLSTLNLVQRQDLPVR